MLLKQIRAYNKLPLFFALKCVKQLVYTYMFHIFECLIHLFEYFNSDLDKAKQWKKRVSEGIYTGYFEKRG